MTMRIRAASAEDAADIAKVHVLAWRAAYRGVLPSDYLDSIDVRERTRVWQGLLHQQQPEGTTLVAESEAGVFGFARASRTRDDDQDATAVGEVHAIYLLPEAWGLGAGRRLLDAVLAGLNRKNFRDVTLWVLEENLRARAFYEAVGWTADGTAKRDVVGGVPVTELRYRRVLV